MGLFDQIGNAFKDLGHKIEKSNNNIKHQIDNSNRKIANDIHKSNDQIAKAFKNIPKPPPPKIDMAALQKATQIIAGVVALTPIGRGLLTAATQIADKADHGAASSYLGLDNTNSTLSMVPGGLLAQQAANVATNGQAGHQLNQYVPDPKRLAMNDAKTIGTSAVHNPKSTLSTTKQVLNGNVHSVAGNAHNVIHATPVKPNLFEKAGQKSTISHAIQAPPKPSLAHFAPPHMQVPPKPVISLPHSTLHIPQPSIPHHSIPVPHSIPVTSVPQNKTTLALPPVLDPLHAHEVPVVQSTMPVIAPAPVAVTVQNSGVTPTSTLPVLHSTESPVTASGGVSDYTLPLMGGAGVLLLFMLL